MTEDAYVLWSLIAALLAVLIGTVLYAFTGLQAGILYLLAVNMVTYLLFRYDKLISPNPRWTRVPERVLAALAMLGGSAGAVIGIYVPFPGGRHKTAPQYRWLRAIVWASLILQALLFNYLLSQ
ncbi:MAG: DUF1294 domain-containing protein [Anaerolineae bacterium]|jgi:uncharacterized membrane protein YsdA (DUF1294 family)